MNPNVADVFDNTFDQSGTIEFQRDPKLVGLVAFLQTTINLIDFKTVAVNPPSDASGNVKVIHSPLGGRGFWRPVVKR